MVYYILNTISKQRTKQVRKGAAAPQRYNQRLCGGTIRLVRGKHCQISEGDLQLHASELAAAQAAGAIEVHIETPMGAVVDFDTLGVEPKELVGGADAQPEPESTDDEAEATPAEEVEDASDEDVEEVVAIDDSESPEEGVDYASLTNKELVELILSVTDEWDEKDLKKLKKAELLELIG